MTTHTLRMRMRRPYLRREVRFRAEAVLEEVPQVPVDDEAMGGPGGGHIQNVQGLCALAATAQLRVEMKKKHTAVCWLVCTGSGCLADAEVV